MAEQRLKITLSGPFYFQHVERALRELVGLQWRHLHLDGSEPEVRVRRAIVRGRVVNPKSKYGRREIALPPSLVLELRAWRRDTEWPGDDDLVFASQAGTPIKVENLRRRALTPTAEEAGVPWIGFHTFRHTRATLMFAAGANAMQMQRMLGHHSPAFTLATYVHLLPEDRFPAADLDAELAQAPSRERERAAA
jgi:integrase